MARAYAGTVMLEGTTLSEGRGTTRPLELFGAPDIDARRVIAEMHALAPHWLDGLHAARLLVRADLPQARRQALQRRADPHRRPGLRSRGLQALAHPGARASRRSAASIRTIRSGAIFRYEYELGNLAIDVINGGPLLREWVDDPAATPHDLDALTMPDEQAWLERAAAASALLRRFRNPAWCPAARPCSCRANIRRCSQRRPVPTTAAGSGDRWRGRSRAW